MCAKLQSVYYFVMSVWLTGTTQLPLDRFSLNLIFFFENLLRKFKFDYNLTRITGTLH